jgi:hypothetical protein
MYAPRQLRLQTAARYPFHCFARVWPPIDLVFAATAEDPGCRAIILADHSVFIDHMMMRKDIDNLKFALNCLDYLGELDRGRRDRALLVVDGKLISDFGKAIPPPVMPPLNDMVPVVNNFLAQMQRDDLFNRVLLEWIPIENVWRRIILTASGALVGFGLWRMARSRYRAEPLPAPAATTIGALELRHRALLAGDNLWEPARTVARRGWEALLGPLTSATRPPTVAGFGWWRWRLRRRIDRLWKLACAAPRPVSAREFSALAADLRSIRASLTAGLVRPADLETKVVA